QARWLALVGVALWVLGWASPARAAADPSCASAEAISELEPDERARLRQLCEGASTPGPQDKATLEAGLRLEGWKAAFVARALARATPPPPEAVEPQRRHEAWLASLLARTRKQRGKEVPACATLRDLVTGSVRDLEAGRLAIPASLHDLEADEGCVPSDERERLERLVAGWRLLTIPRRDEDRVEAFSVDFDQLSVHGVEPIPFDAEGHSAWLLLLPEDRMVTVSVTQPDLDVPWVETRRMADIDFTLSRRRAECVIIEAGTDVGSTWSVVVNGEPTPLEVVSTHQQGRLTQRAILALPQDPRSEQAQLTGGVRSVRQVVFISAGVEPWASSLAEPRDEDHGRCRSVAYDLTGLHSPQEQIGVAQVSVDRQCRNRGIVPSRVRSYAESYTEQANKKLIPLDAWAEVMEVFRELEGRLGSQTSAERGASRGDLDDSEQMIVLASELRRRGVDSLLYFDVRCPQSSMDVTVIGTRVDLDDFVGRARSRVTGIDTDELLDVRSHDSRSRDLRESMEVV
ncbi:MAG: hypothetical protein KDK70_41395, partial [Myxococcales bacterium]|nr:hypothetical protein [Myxococcales bacterium]